jgi:hypothetical protein
MKLFSTIAALLALAILSSAAHADIIAYDNSTNASPLQNFNGSLGLDFNVNTPITVTQLGAFDNGILGNLAGVNGTGVIVAIYDRTTQTQVGPSVAFSPGSPGTQVNGNAFKAIAPLDLPAGFQGTIVSFFDDNYNSFGFSNLFSTESSGGGAISFVGSGRFGFGAVFPTFIDSGPTNRYDAGTFQFVTPQAEGVPEPGTLTLFSLSALGLLSYGGWRRRKGLAM